MALGKKQKATASQLERENQQLGRDAYTQMQPAIDRYGDLASNPDEYRQQMINTYYDPNKSAQWSDAQRQMLRTLGNATARNYNATHGGYSSSGNRAYDDQVRAVNDYAARLWDAGVTGGNNLYQSDLGTARQYVDDLGNIHNLAAAADNIDAYNNLVDQSNKNRFSGILSNVGGVIGSIPTPLTRGIGAGLSLAGAATAKDYSDALAMRAGQMGLKADPNAYKNPATNLPSVLGQIAGNYSKEGANDWAHLMDWVNNRKGQPTSTTPQVTATNPWDEYLTEGFVNPLKENPYKKRRGLTP